MKSKHKFSLIILLIFVSSSISCTKLVEVNPPITSTTGDNVFTNDATAISVLTNIYARLSQSRPLDNFGGPTSLSILAGLSADELKLYSGSSNTTLIQYYRNSLSTSTALSMDFWKIFYPVIYVTNSAIEGLTTSSGLTPIVNKQLLGEAKFIRAFCYFYLVNLYGDVPLVLSTDYSTNSLLKRTSKSIVWAQIISDLSSAQNLLSANYLDATLLNNTQERVRPTKWAAISLLARAYLYKGSYDSAAAEATLVINNNLLYSLDSLNSVFSKNSTEAIWQLQPVNIGWNTEDARVFILPSSGPSSQYPVYLSDTLLKVFEIGDKRIVNWIDSIKVGTATYFYPFKYQSAKLNDPVTEYLMIFRLAEQFLIRAEAKARQGNITGMTGALSDLNTIRNRANLADYSGPTDQASILAAILHERQVELFTEWGHRWLDLKRTNTIDIVMGPVCTQKNGLWSSNWQWYPVPLSELQTDPNLVQNVGY